MEMEKMFNFFDSRPFKVIFWIAMGIIILYFGGIAAYRLMFF